MKFEVLTGEDAERVMSSDVLQVYSTASQRWMDLLPMDTIYDYKLYRIKPQPPKKKRVPLGPGDVKPGDWVRADSNERLTAAVLTVDAHNGNVFMVDGGGVRGVRLDRMLDWKISRDGGKTWRPCWTEVEDE